MFGFGVKLKHGVIAQHCHQASSIVIVIAPFSYRFRGQLPILTLIEDHSPGAHDTLIAACTCWGYRAQGYTDYHENCTDNLSNALGKLGLSVAMTPCPLNLFMNVPVTAEGVLTFQPPLCSKGDYVVFRAEMDCVVVFSACAQEKLPVNGVDGRPTDAHFQIY